MKKLIIGTILICTAVSAGAETYRADVTQDASTYETYSWPGYPQSGTSGSSQTVYTDSYSGSYNYNYASAYLKFDLSGIPEGSVIGNVTLNIKAWGYARVANVNYVGDDNWSETNLHYSSQPSNQVGVANTTGWIIDTNTLWMSRSLDVSAWNTAQDVTDDELSLRLTYGGERATFTAREYVDGADAAYLDISYTPPPPSYTLDVISGVGSPVPAVGSSSVVSGTVVNCSAEDVTIGQTNYTCAGWTMTGQEPASGTTNSFDFTITTNATLTWNWATNYWLDVTVSGSGTVSHADGFYAKDSIQNLTATPETGWLFMGWSADSNVVMSAPQTITVTFSDDADDDGLTNTEEAAAGTNPWKADTDNDGFDDAFELAQGLSPTNNNSAIASYVASRDDIFGLYSSNVVTDVAVGRVALGMNGSNVVLNLQLEESEDGTTWTNAGPPEVWSGSVDGDKQFFRVRSSK